MSVTSARPPFVGKGGLFDFEILARRVSSASGQGMLGEKMGRKRNEGLACVRADTNVGVRRRLDATIDRIVYVVGELRLL